MGKQVLTCIWNFYFSSRRRHTRFSRDWSSDVCSSDLADAIVLRSKRSVPRWLWLLASAPARPVLVFEAGEVPLDRGNARSEERRVGKECRWRCWTQHARHTYVLIMSEVRTMQIGISQV